MLPSVNLELCEVYNPGERSVFSFHDFIGKYSGSCILSVDECMRWSR